MKILLLNPYVTIYKKHPTGTGPNFPMGLAYLAAYLEKNGYEISALDLTRPVFFN